MEKEIAALGFSKMLLALLPTSTTPLDSAFIYSNYPLEWRRKYDEQKLAIVDPTVLHCLRRKAPLAWGPDSFVGAQQQSLYEEARGYGLEAGVTLPVHDVRGTTGMLTCVAPDDSVDSEKLIAMQLPHLTLLRDIAFDSLARFSAPPAQQAAPKLSPREKECLQWHAAGKTSWEIGRILNVTEACVNFHFNNIRNKFKVSHRHEAVIKALTMGVITLV